MIKLKYGEGQPVHESLIVEAEVSLGRWMATRRQKDSSEVREGNRAEHSFLLCVTTKAGHLLHDLNDPGLLLYPHRPPAALCRGKL